MSNKILLVYKSGDYWFWKIKGSVSSSRDLLEYAELIEAGYEVEIKHTPSTKNE